MQNLSQCPVCSSQDIHEVYVGRTTRDPHDSKRWLMNQCSACNLKFLNPQPTWSELQPYYSFKYPAYSRTLDEEDAVAKAEERREYRGIKILPGLSLLDFGCGAGSFLSVMRKLGFRVQGIEPSVQGCKVCESEGIPVFNGTMEEYHQHETGKRKFDIITANHVLEHVPNPVEVLHLMGEMLAPGGLIWIAVPNADCKFAKQLKDRWHSTDIPYHILQFTPKSFTCAAEKAGLQVHRQYTESPESIVASSIRLELRYKWFIPRTLSGRFKIIDNLYAPRLAKKMDLDKQGECLITELGAIT